MNIPAGTLSAWDLARQGMLAVGTVTGELDSLVNSRQPIQALDRLAFARELLDNVEDDIVLIARGAGSSWADIGQALGMTRQAAWERFSKRLTP